MWIATSYAIIHGNYGGMSGWENIHGMDGNSRAIPPSESILFPTFILWPLAEGVELPPEIFRYRGVASPCNRFRMALPPAIEKITRRGIVYFGGGGYR